MIDILIPSLGRAKVLPGLIDNIEATAPWGTYAIWFVLDHADAESRVAVSGRDVEVVLQDGTYPTKVNAGYRSGGRDLVLPTADDVRFHPGWLDAALNALSDPSVQVLGCDDLSPATSEQQLATMPILRRSYVEDPGAVWGETGTVFNEGYTHNFCDNELWELACHRGVTAWAEDCVIEHLHPAWNKREVDETDRKGNLQGWEQDEVLFKRRQRQWSRS